MHMPHEIPGIKDGSVLLVPGDLHFGACDLVVYYLMLRAAEDAGITHAVLQGDNFDCAGLSTHTKRAKSQNTGGLTVEREIDEARVPLSDLRALVKANNHCVAMAGNHENRVNRHVDEFPALDGVVTWDRVYADALVWWDCLPHGSFVQAGALSIFHGDQLKGSLSRYPAEKVLAEYPGQSSMFGHSHRVNSSTKPTWKQGRQVMHGAWNVGHMADIAHPSMAYASDPSWEQSFALVRFHKDKEGTLLFNVSQARVIRDSRNRPTVMVDGKAYK